MPRLGPGERAQIGAAVLAAAAVVDTEPIQDRLARFSRVHQQYLDAQRVVKTHAAQVDAARAALSECNRAQAVCIDRLARVLTNEGESRRNPFSRFGVPTPALLPRLAVRAEVAAIRRLAERVRRAYPDCAPVLASAGAAEAAADTTERALASVEGLMGPARAARIARDTIGLQWNRELAALKRRAQASGDGHDLHLHDALFVGVRRPSKRRATRRQVSRRSQ